MAYKFLIICGGSGKGLLGQHQVLGVNAELQIDVRKEIVPTTDPNSYRVSLDDPVGNINLLINDMRERTGTTIKNPIDLKHFEILAEHWITGGSLIDGLGQSPAIGGGTIANEDNVTELRARLGDMLNDAQNIGIDNPLEVWIVSSTAGGTGAGISRFVASELARAINESTWPAVKLNFIRIGALTYRKVAKKTTALNTFFSVAADAAYALTSRKNFPGVTTNWFYVDLPDVGKGDDVKPIREELIEMAAKAIMLDELSSTLDGLLINDGLRMVLARAGFWGRDFQEKVKFFETLKQLAGKLQDLLEPDYYQRFIEGRKQPKFIPGLSFAGVKTALEKEEFLLAMFDKAQWKLPKYDADARFEVWLGELKKSADELINKPLNIETLAAGVDVQISDLKEGKDEPISLGVPDSGSDEGWFRVTFDTQRVKAWCSESLKPGNRNKTTQDQVAKLRDLHSKCAASFYSRDVRKGPQDKAKDLSKLLPDLVETLCVVTRLRELEDLADQRLNAQFATTRELYSEVIRQRDLAKSAVGGLSSAPILVADLYQKLDPLGGETWLNLLETAFRGGDPQVLKKQVLAGATGLTDKGLQNVLGLGDNTIDIPMIRDTLKRKMGRMRGQGRDEFEAQWWQAKSPKGVGGKHYVFRVFPNLSDQMKAKLGKGDGSITYQYTEVGVVGVNVLAFECASVAKAKFDAVSTPAYLLSPFIQQVRSTLANWPKNPEVGESHGPIEIASAGVIGDPLYLKAMRKAGLREGELGKIGQLYQLFNPKSSIRLK